MKKKQRFLSFVLCMLLLVTTFVPMTAFAENGGIISGAEKARYEMALLKEQDGSYVKMTRAEIDAIKAGDSFFVGVEAIDLANVNELANGTGNAGGVGTISFGINYDSNYLKLEPNNRNASNGNLNSNKVKQAITDRLATITGNFATAGDYGYDITAADKASEVIDEMRTVKVDISSNAAADNLPGEYNGATDEMLVILEFSLEAAAPEKGATVFQFSEFTGDNVLRIGIGSDVTLYQGTSDATRNDDVRTVIDFIADEADIFPVMYTLTFHDNVPSGITVDAGTSVQDDTQTVQHDLSITSYAAITGDTPAINGGKIPTAKGQGKGVSGWADVDGNPFTVDTVVTTDMAIYAQWSDSYEVTFDPTDRGSFADTVTPPVKVEKASGAAMTAEEILTADKVVAPEGYKFFKWNTQENGGGDDVVAGYTVKGTTTAYAIYQAATPGLDPTKPDEDPTPLKDSITVHFDANGGTGVKPTTVYVASGGAIQDVGGFPNPPIKDKYKFADWYTTAIETAANDNKVEANTVLNDLAVDGELTLYAHWDYANDVADEDKLQVTLHNNFDKSKPDEGIIGTVDVVSGTAIGITATVINRPGFELNRWQDGTGTKTFNLETTPITEVGLHLYPIWTADIDVQYSDDSKMQQYSSTAKGVTVSAIMSGGVDISKEPNGLKEGVDYDLIYNSTADENVTPVNKDDYTVVFALKNDPEEPSVTNGDEIEILSTSFEEWQIVEREVKVALSADSPNGQIVPTNEDKDITLLFETDDEIFLSEHGKNDFVVKYFEWDDDETDENGKGILDKSEVIKDETGSGTVARNIGKYVVEISIADSNYKVGSLDESVQNWTLADGDEANWAIGSYIMLELTNMLSVDDMKVQFVPSGSAIAVDGTLYEEDTLTTEAAFTKDGTAPYYTQVKPDEEIQVVLTGKIPQDTPIAVTIGGVSVDVTPEFTKDGDGNDVVTIKIPTSALKEADGDPTDKGFKNDVVIGVDDNEYTIKVRQLIDAKVELAPGNSPYGLIERMSEKWYTGEGTAWTEEEIVEAKKAFDSVNKFTSGYTPDKGNTAALYTVEAWVGDGEDVSSEDIKNPEINMDRNVNTQFYYNKSEYQEMGFTAYNSDGTTVAAIDVTVTIGLDKMAADNINNFKDDAVEHDDAVNVADLGEEISARPGIYTLTYSFEDKISKETITNTRKFVVVWENGDADLSGYLNSGDADAVYDVLARRLVPYNGVIDSSANVHKYRMLDVDNSQYVNSGDADAVYDALARRSTLVVYYSNI